MNREECFDDLRSIWEKYGIIDHPEYTPWDKEQMKEFLDDIERLLKWIKESW